MPLTHAGELAALGTAVCWTVSALSFESASRRAGSLSVNLIRLAFALVPLTLYSWLHRGIPLPWDASGHAWLWLAASGIVGFTLGDMLLFRALVVLGARLTMLIMALVPPMTAVLGLAFMGEQLGIRDWAGMAVTVAGVAGVVLGRDRGASGKIERVPLSGVLLALGGAFGQALGLILSKKGMGDYDAFAATQIRVIAGLAGFSLLFLAIGWWSKVRTALADTAAMARTGLGAFFGPFLGVSLSLVAVKHTETGVAATIMALVPVLILVPSALLYKERVGVRAVAGAAVAVVGCAMLFL